MRLHQLSKKLKVMGKRQLGLFIWLLIKALFGLVCCRTEVGFVADYWGFGNVGQDKRSD